MTLTAIGIFLLGIGPVTLNATEVTSDSTIVQTLKKEPKKGLKDGPKEGLKDGLKKGLKHGMKKGKLKGDKK